MNKFVLKVKNGDLYMFFKIITKYQQSKSFVSLILFLISSFMVNGCTTTEYQKVPCEDLKSAPARKIAKLIMQDSSVINANKYNAVYHKWYEDKNDVVVLYNKLNNLKQDTVRIKYVERIINLKDVSSVVVKNNKVNAGLTILAVALMGLAVYGISISIGWHGWR